jgi:multidrug resistance efflux pump
MPDRANANRSPTQYRDRLDRIDPAHRGDSIRKGAVLVTLESRAERATLELARYKSKMTGAILAAQTKHDYAERKFIRRRDMYAEKLMSTQDKEEAEGDMKSAEADLQVARENQAKSSNPPIPRSQS